MELETEWVDYDSPAGSVSAYLARPRAAGGPLPGILVFQEIWGVDGHIVDLVQRFAGAGYVAMAPDLFSLGGGRPPALEAGRVEQTKQFLNTIPSAEWTAILGDNQRRAQALGELPGDQGELVGETLGVLFGQMRGQLETFVELGRAAFGFLRAHPLSAGRPVGATGYCLGGSVSARLGCAERDLAAAVVYYGGPPEPDQVATIRCPLRGFYGQDDPRIVEGLPAFAESLRAAGVDHELLVYPDTPHAFFNDTRASYRPESARDAWGRTLAFFAQTLDPAPVAPVG
ncbi:MAG: dienelactone hydrolase family protein [Actinomycetota bacterium]|nr:dienelactone hydrolase family protein [Actinomycetota bacterium]